MKTSKQIFISYSRQDLTLVRELVQKIEAESHVDCWIDWNGIESGEQFEDVIVKAIDDCEVVIFMLSKHSLDSFYAKKEISYAYNIKKKIIPVIIDNCKLQGWFLFKFGDLDYIDATNSLQMDKLMRNLKDLFSHSAYDEDSITRQNEIDNTYDGMDGDELFNLAEAYYYGDDGKQEDKSLALYLYEKAAEANNPDARLRVIECYEKGEGTTTNMHKAFEWLTISANKGDISSLFKIGQYYENGTLGETDFATAISWYKQGAEKGNIDSIHAIATCYLYGRGTDIDLDKAITYYTYLADNYPNAMNNLGVCYERKQDYEHALLWYQKAAECGIATAQANVGMYYYQGMGVEIDKEEALKWLLLAAESDEPSALNYLGVIYERGEIVDKDMIIAAEYYRKSAELGNQFSQCNYGFCFLNGYGVEKDYRNAVRWFKKAAKSNVPNALYNLGVCYEYGYGVQQNIAEARHYYERAASLGLEMAKESLKTLDQKQIDLT